MSEAVAQFDGPALFYPDCCRQVAAIIAANGGREVFFVGKAGAEGRIAEVEAYAFGTDDAVPAVIHQAQYGDVVLHNHPSGDLEPSGPDIAVASALGDAGVGCYIVDNACERVRVVVRAFRPPTVEPLDVEETGRALGPRGLLARALEDYEHRPQQVEMAQAVTRAFNEDRIAVIEAGTGVGKSMAYLVPAVQWALTNRQRVVVSTNTINLQEQLIRKDIPLLQRHAGLDFRSVLVKGRQNYVCLRRVHAVRGETAQPEFESFRSELTELLDWAAQTQDGSLADLAVRPTDAVWDLIKVEADNCTRAQCRHYHRCFFYQARREASRAHVIVCNHHILMADLVLRLETNNYTASAVLPPFQRLIIDEAHNLEDVATNYLGIRLTRRAMRHLLGRIYASPPNRRPTGVLAVVLRKLAEAGERKPESPLPGQAVAFIHHTVMPLLEEVRHKVDQECAAIFEGALECLDQKTPKEGEEMALRMTPEVESHTSFGTTLVESVHGMAAAFGELAKALDGLGDLLEEAKETLGGQAEYLRLEVQAQRDRAVAVAADLAGFLANKDGYCRWIELRRVAEGSIVRLRTAPIDVGPGLRETLFEPCPTVVLTSATLTVGQSFDYLLERLGLLPQERGGRRAPQFADDAALPAIQTDRRDRETDGAVEKRLVTLALDTPFDFDRQAFVAVPTDIAEPDSADFAGDLESLILESVRITRGRAFVLFTSYSLLERLHDALRGKLEAIGCVALKQGAVNRHLLLNRFRSERAPVLFATSSFWEGVDVRGEALVCLILTRLPFRVPTDPIVQARVEHLARRGRDAFADYTVPQAVIKFKQGFGRLIRHKEDRGAVLILDRRVITKRYGATFLRSLPSRVVHQLSRAEMLESMRRFFGAEGRDQ